MKHCVKSIRIRSYSGPYFPSLGLNTEIYSVPLRIRTLFTQCKLTTDFKPGNKVVSSVTKKMYYCIVPPGITLVNYQSSNLVFFDFLWPFLFSICWWSQSRSLLIERFEGHKNGLRHPEKHGRIIFSERFNVRLCMGGTCKIQILIPQELNIKLPNKMSGKSFLLKLNHKVFNNLPDTVNFLMVTIASLNKISFGKQTYICSGTWWTLTQ